MLGKDQLLKLLQQGGIIIRVKASNGIDDAECYHFHELVETPLDYEQDVEPLVDDGTLDIEYPNAWDGSIVIFRLRGK